MPIYGQITEIVNEIIESLLKAPNKAANLDIQELIELFGSFTDKFQKLNNVQIVDMLEVIKKVFVFIQKILRWKYSELNETMDNKLKIETLEKKFLVQNSYIRELEEIIESERKTTDADIKVEF